MVLGAGDRPRKLFQIVPGDRLTLSVRGADVMQPWVGLRFLDGALDQMVDGANCLAEAAMHDKDVEAVLIKHLV